MTRVPSWTIVAGLGTLGREEVCDLLAIFRDAGLYNLAVDRVADIAGAVGLASKAQDDGNAFKLRLAETSRSLATSPDSDGLLRLRLWAALRETFDAPPILPLSIRAAAPAATDLAHAAAVALADSIPRPAPEGDGESWMAMAKSVADKVTSMFAGGDAATFDEVVSFQAVRLTAQAAESGLLDAAAKDDLVRKVREKLADLPPELRDEAVEHALKSGDAATLGLLVSGSSLVGLGVAVDLAGFAAYQLAAQASAFLPLIGGKAAVSGLFVLANPVFIVPALIGGGVLMGCSLHDSVREKLAGSLVVLLALRGLAAGHDGLKACLDGFRSLDVETFEIGELAAYADSLSDARTRAPGLPPCPSAPPAVLAEAAVGNDAGIFVDVLFPDADGAERAEAHALTGLTVGDIVYSAASIDPKVIEAADFAHKKDLGDIFRLGEFADELDDYAGSGLIGVENRLRGYVAERVVAARLQEQGLQVEFPETANHPGVDIFVDGEPFQVKCLSSLRGIADHFDKYPDIPVYANFDLVEAAASSGADWADKVHAVEGFDYEITDRIMHRSLEAGADLMHVDEHVPVFAIAVSAARNIHGWWKGSVPLSNLPFEVAVGGAIKGGLAVAGGFVGKGLGLLLLGPAGAVVGGGLGGGLTSILGRGRVRAAVDGLVSPEWEKRAGAACDAFLDALDGALSRKAAILTRKLELLAADLRPEARWIADRIADDRLFVVEGAVRVAALRREATDIQEKVQSALRIMHDHAVHPWTVREELAALIAVVDEKPTVVSTAAELSREAVEKANELIGGLMKGWLPKF
jgi:hypothetical protein